MFKKVVLGLLALGLILGVAYYATSGDLFQGKFFGLPGMGGGGGGGGSDEVVVQLTCPVCEWGTPNTPEYLGGFSDDCCASVPGCEWNAEAKYCVSSLTGEKGGQTSACASYGGFTSGSVIADRARKAACVGPCEFSDGNPYYKNYSPVGDKCTLPAGLVPYSGEPGAFPPDEPGEEPDEPGEEPYTGEPYTGEPVTYTSEPISVCEFLSFGEIGDFYGSEDFQLEKNAYEICNDMDYQKCFAGQINGWTSYYSSTDGSCQNLQYRDSYNELVECDMKHQPADCNTSLSNEEPMFGDQEHIRNLVDVICCGKIYKPKPSQDSYVTRCDLLSKLGQYNMLGSPYTPEAATFPDVPKGSWCSLLAETANHNGIMAGYVDGTFGPGNYINKAETSTVIAKGADLPLDKDNPAFPFIDVPEDAWYYAYISALDLVGAYDIAEGLANYDPTGPAFPFNPEDFVKPKWLGFVVGDLYNYLNTIPNTIPVATGSLTITTATDNPASDILVAGSSKNKMLKIKVTASPEEDIFIKELTVRNDENLDDIALASLSLDVENDLYGISIGKFALQSNGNNAGYVTWNTSINVPANTSINLVVKGDILSSQQASVSGTTPALSVLGANDIKAVGASSGAEIVVSGKAVGNPMYVYNTKPTIAAGAASPQGASSASSGMIIGEFIVNAANNPADTGENALTIDNMDITFLKNGVSLTNVKLYPKMKDLDPAYALTPQWLTEGIVRFGEDDSTVENWANWTTSGYDKVIENSSQTYVLRADVANAANGSLLVKFGNLGTAGQSSLGEGDEPGDFDWNDGTTNGVFWVKQSSTEVKLNAATLTFASASGGM